MVLLGSVVMGAATGALIGHLEFDATEVGMYIGAAFGFILWAKQL